MIKLPLYNKIRNLKRQLQTVTSKLERQEAKRRRVEPKPIAEQPRVEAVLDENVTIATPEKNAQAIMREDNISPNKAPNTLKQLVTLNILAKEVSAAPKKIKKKLLCKKGSKLYPRCKSQLARKIGLNRHYVLSPNTKKRNDKRTKYAIQKKKVVTFLKRSDNSSMLPGKKDALAHGVQRYALNDTMKNLFNKFMTEFPEFRISFSTFSKQRPKWIKSIKWCARRQCLCIKHQNMALKLKAMNINMSPNLFVKQYSDEGVENLLQTLPNHDIKFQVWRSEEIRSSQDKLFRKVRLQTDKVNKETFVEVFEEEFQIFKAHVHRTTEQYVQLKQMRESLDPVNEVSVQMDYSENYACIYQDEPAQVFYDRRNITIHPMVVHYTSEDGQLHHKSFAGISDITQHSAGMALAFITKLMPHILEIKPNVQIVHYITDSPASQYRNKSILKLVAQHAKLFPGIYATWDYLEAGHGKGPCDGIGGSIKKRAEIAVKKGTIITSGSEFVTWANTEYSVVKLFLAKEGEVKSAERSLKNATYVKGIANAHSVRSGDVNLFLRETSCYNECCRKVICCHGHGWQETNVPVFKANNPISNVNICHGGEVSGVNVETDNLVPQVVPEDLNVTVSHVTLEGGQVPAVLPQVTSGMISGVNDEKKLC